jgi:ATP-dependent DNA helicase RecG
VDVAEVETIIKTLREQGADNLDVEAKASETALPKSVKETLSAFANTGGGVLLLGVAEADGFKVVGVSDPAKIASDLGSACANEVDPPLRPVIKQLQVEGKWVIVAEVNELETSLKPCFVLSRGMTRGSYVRVHDGDHILSSYEVQLLLSNRGQPKHDTEPVMEARVADLDDGLLASYVSRVRDLRSTATRGLTDEQILTRHNLAREIDGTLHPTIAGLLSLGRHPQQFFPQLMVTLVVYPTVTGPDLDSGERFIDNVAVEGPIPVMARDALAALKRNMRRRSRVVGIGRADTWEYPEAALREAIVNALVHRDLSPAARGSQVQIEMYPDRLSIRNPGGLYGPVSVVELTEASTSDVAGTSSARNSFLLRALEDIQLPEDDRTVCENRGSGIRTMVESLRSAGMSPPRFNDTISSFNLVVPNHALLDGRTVEWISSLGVDGLTDSQCIGLALLKSGDTLDNARYRAATGLDSRVATSELQDLVARGLVSQIGTRRWTEYRLPVEVGGDASSEAETNDAETPADPSSSIIEALRAAAHSRSEIARLTGMSVQVAGRWLRTLRSEGLVRIHGGAAPTSPNVRYELTPEARGQAALDFDFDADG